MEPTYETTWPLFVGILAGYILLSLFLGAKGTYFEPYKRATEELDVTGK